MGLSLTGQALSFDQSVTVAEVMTNPGYYQGSEVTITGLVHGLRWEDRTLFSGTFGEETEVTVYIFEFTDDSGTMTAESFSFS